MIEEERHPQVGYIGKSAYGNVNRTDFNDEKELNRDLFMEEFSFLRHHDGDTSLSQFVQDADGYYSYPTKELPSGTTQYLFLYKRPDENGNIEMRKLQQQSDGTVHWAQFTENSDGHTSSSYDVTWKDEEMEIRLGFRRSIEIMSSKKGPVVIGKKDLIVSPQKEIVPPGYPKSIIDAFFSTENHFRVRGFDIDDHGLVRMTYVQNMGGVGVEEWQDGHTEDLVLPITLPGV